MNVLLHAYACNPNQGSEEGVGWDWVRVIAQDNDVCVITAEYHRADVLRAVEEGRIGPVRFVFVPHRFFHYRPNGFWKLVESTVLKPLMNLAYHAWQRDAYRLAEQLCREQRFDLVHLVTYVGFRFPGKLHRLDLPFVWGPVGGLENTPWRFLPMLGAGGAIYYAGRNIINSLQKRFLPGPKRAFAKAGACGGIIAATAGIQREVREWYGQSSEIICEIGPPSVVATSHSKREPGEPLQLAWSGLHLPGKAPPLLLRAAARLPPEVQWKLKILGGGPCTKKWQKLATTLGISERCQWLGWLPREQAVREMNQAHVFVITSLKDLTSTVLLEALSQGLPVVCPDHCGFSNVVTPDCGIKLPLESPEQLQSDLAGAILRLEQNEAERRRLAAGALRRVQDFSWGGKAQALNAIYERAVRSYAKAGAVPLAPEAVQT